MFALIRHLFGRFASHWDIISSIFNWSWTIGGGAVVGWGTWATGLFAQYAPFSWVAAGVVGAIIAALITAVVAWSRTKLSYARYIDRSGSPGDNVNPLDDSFHRKRISLTSFVSPPYNNLVRGKTFDQCELFGPAVVVLRGNITMSHNEIHFCDFVAIGNKAVPVNGISFADVTIIRSKMFGIVFLVHESRVQSMIDQGIPFITYVPEKERTKQGVNATG
jgi:hypothetical protein